MSKIYRYDYEWDSRNCYPYSFVLKNKLGIREAEPLHIAEREIASDRILAARVNPMSGRFDLKHLRPSVSTDSKQRQREALKKLAQGHKLQSEQEQEMDMTM